MDLLDRVLSPAGPLLRRIDDVLTVFGAAPDHPIWPLARRVGALPGAAVEHVSGLLPDAPHSSAGLVRSIAERCRDDVATVALDPHWHGVTAEAYASRWSEISRQVTDVSDGLDARLDASAAYLVEIAGWIANARRDLAGELAVCVGSVDAVRLRTAPEGSADPDAIRAAADMGAQILGSVATFLTDGWHLYDRWSGRLAQVALKPPSDLPTMAHTHIELR